MGNTSGMGDAPAVAFVTGGARGIGRGLRRGGEEVQGAVHPIGRIAEPGEMATVVLSMVASRRTSPHHDPVGLPGTYTVLTDNQRSHRQTFR
jgi:hypothetical protein